MAPTAAKLNGPAMIPPPGVLPNFDNPPNLDHIFILTVTLCMTFPAIAVLLRLYTKIYILRKTAFEDYVLLLGWVLSIIQAVLIGMSVRYGGGVHQWNVRLKDFFKMLYWVNIATIIYNPTLFVIKLSILIQYLRVFVPSRRANMSMFIAVYAVIVATFIFYSINMTFNIFICRPREKFWNRLMITGSCFNVDALMQSTGLSNVIFDFLILVLPIQSIWKLQVPLRRKWGIVAAFATGMLACVASLVRVYYAFEVVKSDDVSYKIGIIGFCTLVEIAIGIIVSCLPVLPRLFQAFSPHISSAFSFQSKTGGITSRTSHTLILGTNGKKHPDGYVDLCGTRPAGQDASSPRHERGLPPPRRTVTNDSSPTLPAPSKTAPGQILQTTRIETEVVTEMDAANVSYANMNRQQLGW